MLGASFPCFSAAEFERRMLALRAAMDSDGLAAVLIYGGPGAPEISYLTNYLPASPCWLIIPRSGDPVVFVHFYNHVPCTQAMSIVADVRGYGPVPAQTLAQELRARKFDAAKLGIVSLNTVPYNQVKALDELLPAAELVEFGRAYNAIRWIRSAEELPFLRRSERELRPGLTEFEIRSIITRAYNDQESDPGIHFIATTSMAAPDRFVPWQRVTPRTLSRGDVVITELTVSYWGYSTQIHRPFAIGAEPVPVYRELFDAALECYENIRRISTPGTTSREIVAASSVIEERGFATYDSVFHGERGKFPEIGTASSAHPPEDWTLRENMVHVIQPNPITRDYTAGLQLGAAIIVTPAGGEPLHRYPFVFPVCG
jgi:Xaa-Pro aminopeptidase